MSDKVDRGLQIAINRINRIIDDPNTDPEKAGRLIYALRDSYARRLAVKSSQFGNIIKGIKKGESGSGFILGGGQLFGRDTRSEIAINRIARAAHSIPGENRFPLVVRSKNPLSELYESVAINWHNRFDRVGKHGTQHRYGTQTTAVVPYRKPYDPESLRSAIGAAFNPNRNAGVGRIDDATRLTDINWGYNEAQEAPSGDNFFAPVTKEQGDKWVRERNDDLEFRKKLAEAQMLKHSQWAKYRNDFLIPEHERGINALKEEYGDNAENAYRKILIKELPTFFKNSKMSTKSLQRWSNFFKSTRKTPIVGAAAKAIFNPVTLPLAAANLFGSIASQSDTSNAEQVKWANILNMNGSPSQRFQMAAYAAGIKDIGHISDLYGKLTLQYGDAELFLSSIGQNLKGKGTKERLFAVNALQMTPEMLAMADIFSGDLKPGDNRRFNATKNMMHVARIMSTGSDGLASEKLAWWLSDKITFGNAESLSTRFADIDWSDIAQSGVNYDASVGQNAAAVSSADSHDVQINQTITVNGGAEEAGKAVGEKTADASRQAVAQHMDPMAQ